MPIFDYTQFPRAGLLRRLASGVYDLLLAIAVYMVAGALGFAIFAIFAAMGLVDMSGSEHLIEVQQSSLLYSGLIYLWNLLWVAYFFVYFWNKSGQTLGMKAWRLRLQNTDGTLISKTTAIKRLVPTLLGLGNLWLIIDRTNKQSLQDKMTNTEVVLLSLAANRGRL
ncbi:RDD family protein [Thalassotalea piscium]|uniref:Putative RDD family membrane protein YckC n=1 Tax=Thalassotalea piscium TaxID=1230533 RepID=A0A7X0TU13_9GAMM|nr:RDD family protein [Thalassotalea piscium]MBB6543841.1 putative RDD family membrane protein YckC [Thalassotalea piscium]